MKLLKTPQKDYYHGHSSLALQSSNIKKMKSYRRRKIHILNFNHRTICGLKADNKDIVIEYDFKILSFAETCRKCKQIFIKNPGKFDY